MEPIKIVDKLTLRQEALRMAVEISKSHARAVAATMNNADMFEDYIKGKADLPEYADPNEQTKQFAGILAKMQEGMCNRQQWVFIPRNESGQMPNDLLECMRKEVPFCMHDQKRNNNFFVADEAEFDNLKNEIMNNPRYDAYCPVALPKYEQPNAIAAYE